MPLVNTLAMGEEGGAVFKMTMMKLTKVKSLERKNDHNSNNNIIIIISTMNSLFPGDRKCQTHNKDLIISHIKVITKLLESEYLKISDIRSRSVPVP